MNVYCIKLAKKILHSIDKKRLIEVKQMPIQAIFWHIAK